MRFPEGRMNLLETKKLIVAFGWTRDMRPFRDEDMEEVSDWANNPETPQETLDAVLEGSMAIDLVDGTIVLKKRRYRDYQRLKEAFKKLEELHRAEIAEQDPFMN